MKINTDKVINNDRSAITERQIKPKDDGSNTSIMDSNIGCDDGFDIEEPSVKFNVKIKGKEDVFGLDKLPDLGFLPSFKKDDDTDESNLNTDNENNTDDETIKASDIESLEFQKDINLGKNGKITFSSDLMKFDYNSYNGKVKYQYDIMTSNKLTLTPYTTVEYEQRKNTEELNTEEYDDTEESNIKKEKFINYENGIQGKYTPSDDLKINFTGGIKFAKSLENQQIPQFDSAGGKINLQYTPRYDLDLNLNGELSFSDPDNNTKSIELNVQKNTGFGNSANLKAKYSETIDSNIKLDDKNISRNFSISGDLKKELKDNTSLSLSGEYDVTQNINTLSQVTINNSTEHSFSLNTSLGKKISEEKSVNISAGYNLYYLQNDTPEIKNNISAKAEIKHGNATISSELNLPVENPKEFKNTIGVKINFN